MGSLRLQNKVSGEKQGEGLKQNHTSLCQGGQTTNCAKIRPYPWAICSIERHPNLVDNQITFFHSYGMKKSLFCLIFLLAACASPQNPQPTAAETPILPTATAVSANTLAPLTPTPSHLRSEEATFTAELNQEFGLKWDQSVEIAREGIIITHTTDIEFECPPESDCEVPLITTDYFEFSQNGESLGQQRWQPELVFGDYVLETAVLWRGYNYEEHQFEIILIVRKANPN